MNQGQFEMIIAKIDRKYGHISKGHENIHIPMLFPIECNLLKIHRKYPTAGSRRLAEAVCLVFYRIEGYLSGEQTDVSKFENDDNIKLRDAILYSFDPFSNDNIKVALEDEFGFSIDDKDFLDAYFREPVQCVRRIYDSAKMWEKRSGSNGYFNIIEQHIGADAGYDGDMLFSVIIPEEFL